MKKLLFALLVVFWAGTFSSASAQYFNDGEGLRTLVLGGAGTLPGLANGEYFGISVDFIEINGIKYFYYIGGVRFIGGNGVNITNYEVTRHRVNGLPDEIHDRFSGSFTYNSSYGTFTKNFNVHVSDYYYFIPY